MRFADSFPQTGDLPERNCRHVLEVNNGVLSQAASLLTPLPHVVRKYFTFFPDFAINAGYLLFSENRRSDQ